MIDRDRLLDIEAIASEFGAIVGFAHDRPSYEELGEAEAVLVWATTGELLTSFRIQFHDQTTLTLVLITEALYDLLQGEEVKE